MVMTIGELATRCWNEIKKGVTCYDCEYRKICELADKKVGVMLFPVVFDEDYELFNNVKDIRIDYIG